MNMKILASALTVILLAGIAGCVVDEPVDTDYSGTWTCTEESTLYGTQSFQVQLKNDPVIAGQVSVANFYNLGFDKEAIMTFNGTAVIIPFQNVSGYEIDGDGSAVNANRLELNYFVSDGIDLDTVQAVMIR